MQYDVVDKYKRRRWCFVYNCLPNMLFTTRGYKIMRLILLQMHKSRETDSCVPWSHPFDYQTKSCICIGSICLLSWKNDNCLNGVINFIRYVEKLQLKHAFYEEKYMTLNVHHVRGSLIGLKVLGWRKDIEDEVVRDAFLHQKRLKIMKKSVVWSDLTLGWSFWRSCLCEKNTRIGQSTHSYYFVCQEVFAKYNHPPYSADLVPCDIFLFSQGLLWDRWNCEKGSSTSHEQAQRWWLKRT